MGDFLPLVKCKANLLLELGISNRLCIVKTALIANVLLQFLVHILIIVMVILKLIAVLTNLAKFVKHSALLLHAKSKCNTTLPWLILFESYTVLRLTVLQIVFALISRAYTLLILLIPSPLRRSIYITSAQPFLVQIRGWWPATISRNRLDLPLHDRFHSIAYSLPQIQYMVHVLVHWGVFLKNSNGRSTINVVVASTNWISSFVQL
jgi:hypothetical protein